MPFVERKENERREKSNKTSYLELGLLGLNYWAPYQQPTQYRQTVQQFGTFFGTNAIDVILLDIPEKFCCHFAKRNKVVKGERNLRRYCALK